MTEDAKPIDAEQEPETSFSTEASSGRGEGVGSGFDVVEDEDEEALNRALSRALKTAPKGEDGKGEDGKGKDGKGEDGKPEEELLSEATIDLDAEALSKDEAEEPDAEESESAVAEADEDEGEAGEASRVEASESDKDGDEAARDGEASEKGGSEKGHSDKGSKDGDGAEPGEKDGGRVPSAREALGVKDGSNRRASRPLTSPRGERRPSGRVSSADASRRVPAPRRAAARKSAPMRPEAHPLHANLQSLSLRASNIEANTQKIARALVEIVKEGENRKRAYDTLYDEMRQYKEDFLYRAQKPLFLELITLFDSILRVERQYEAKEGMDEAARDIRYLKDVLLEILYRYDIEVIEEHPEKLDISIQKPIKRVDVTDPAEDRVVVQYVREGFKRDNTVLRPQEIIVKRYCKAKEE